MPQRFMFSQIIVPLAITIAIGAVVLYGASLVQNVE